MHLALHAAAVAWAGLATREPSAFGEHLDLVDELAWAASEREVARYVRESTRAGSLHDRAFREEASGWARRLPSPTTYAVRAEVLQEGAALWVREAVVYTHRGARPLDDLVLRVFGNGVGAEGGRTRLRSVWVDGRPAPATLDDTLLRVELPRRLRRGGRVRLLLELTQMVPRFDPRPDGPVTYLNAADTGAFGRLGDHVNLGHWLPVVTPVGPDGAQDQRPLPRNGEHGWFDPSMFHVVVEMPAGWSMASTGVEVDRATGDGQVAVVAVAAAAREFAVELGIEQGIIASEVDGTTVRVFHPRDRPEVGEALRAAAVEALRWGNQALGPLAARELDVVSTPLRVVLGNEFPDLFTIDVPSDGSSPPAAEHRWTLAHEVAHQWWYAEVGNDPQAEPWVDEALANHFAAMFWEDAYGREAVEARFDALASAPLAELLASGVSPLPADLPGDSYDLAQYSVLVYGRGMLFLDAVRALLGDDAYLAALRRYRRMHRLRSATGEDLLWVFRSVAEHPSRIDDLYREWMAAPGGSLPGEPGSGDMGPPQL